MNIIVPLKIVPDDQDVQVAPDRSLDFSRAKLVVSSYDLNAIEAAAQISAATEGKAVAISAGGKVIDDSKTKKNILSRGVSELYMVADDACVDMDAFQTASVLAELVEKAGAFDLIICGDGSADNYTQQVDVQLAAKLGIPSVNGVSEVVVNEGFVTCKRVLEDVVETVEVAFPALISVTPEAAQPRIPGMKDILAAGKKPMDVAGAANVPAARIEIVECKAPEQATRKLEVLDASEDGAIEKFAAALKAAL